MTGQSGEPVLAVAQSDDGGQTFTERRVVSGGVTAPGGAALLALRDGIALAFHGSTDGQPPAVRYRTIESQDQRQVGGALSPIETLSPSSRSAAYPSLVMHDGRRIAGWVDRTGQQSRVYVTVSPMPRIQ
jgi:hypothetical protein